MSVVQWAKRRGTGLALATKPPKLVAVALSTAHTAWALLTKKEPGVGGRAGCRLKGFPGSDSACAGRRGQGRRESKGKRSRVNQRHFLCAA